jgi:Protein of unknown function DUF2625
MESPNRAWPLVQRWIDQATNDVTMLPADQAGGERALEALAVSDRSVLGALVLHTGGLSIDHGWLRVLGGPALLDWSDQVKGGMIVGHDVVAGFYSVDKQDGEVRYLAPDTLEWEGTEMGHSAWVHWTLTGEIGAFYEALRWPGWEEQSATLAPDTGFTVHPPPFTREGRLIAESTKTAAPMTELWAAQQEFVRQYVGD